MVSGWGAKAWVCDNPGSRMSWLSCSRTAIHFLPSTRQALWWGRGPLLSPKQKFEYAKSSVDRDHQEVEGDISQIVKIERERDCSGIMVEQPSRSAAESRKSDHSPFPAHPKIWKGDGHSKQWSQHGLARCGLGEEPKTRKWQAWDKVRVSNSKSRHSPEGHSQDKSWHLEQ